MKVGVVGPHTWFSGHYPEGWESNADICCINVDESDYRFLINLRNYRPDISLFYRPELYPKRYVEAIPGYKIAFLSEPIPAVRNGEFVRSAETDLRLRVYSRMSWGSYDRIFYYDRTKQSSVMKLGWELTGFQPMPIDIDTFTTLGQGERWIDVFFIGKPTEHRIKQMMFLRTIPLNYRWVAHGVTGKELADAFRASKVVLNIHADGLPAVEPRIALAAICGAIVLSEELDGAISPFEGRVIEYRGDLTHELVLDALRTASQWSWDSAGVAPALSARQFVQSQYEQLL